MRNIERGQIIDEMDEIFVTVFKIRNFTLTNFYVKMKSMHLICTNAIFKGRNQGIFKQKLREINENYSDGKMFRRNIF